ncbi:MAG: hypothetical protein LBM98_11630 [Oscillospiraceae bacterium]|nr:hypothetical protein [Oscillospiraceae bacterium]
MRSTGKPAIRRALQVRSNPVPGGQHTYVSQVPTSTLDCFAAYHRYVSQVRWRLRKDGLGFAKPCPGALRRDGGRGYVRARRGEPPRRFAAPLPRGEFARDNPRRLRAAPPSPEGGFFGWTRVARGASRVQSPAPFREGGASAEAGGVPRRAQPSSKLSSLIFDIC